MTSNDHGQLLQTLRALECELHGPQARGDAARLAELLHPEFREFGRSGRSYTQAEIVARLLAEPVDAPEAAVVVVHAQDFVLSPLADGLALLTYRSAHRAGAGALERHTNRSSIWRRGPAGWQMLFHQGTPTDVFLPA